MGAPTAMRRPRALPVLALCAATLNGCGGPPATDSYFPLEAGHRWVYAQQTRWENGSSDDETVVLRTEDEQDLPSGGRGWRRRSESGLDYWLRSDSTGIYRVASKTDSQAEAQPDKPTRYVLKLPLAVGTSWQASTTTYLLKRNADFPPEIRHSHAPVNMVYRIEALDEQVSTPAGQFKPCIRVQGSAVIKLFADPVAGFRDLPLDTTEWYCKGVGLVKLQRSEPAHSSFLTGGTTTLELVDWD